MFRMLLRKTFEVSTWKIQRRNSVGQKKLEYSLDPMGNWHQHGPQWWSCHVPKARPVSLLLEQPLHVVAPQQLGPCRRICTTYLHVHCTVSCSPRGRLMQCH